MPKKSEGSNARPAPAPWMIEELANSTESINLMAFADPGAGKTVLAGTHDDMLIVSFEPGTISAKRQGSKAQLVSITEWRQFSGFLADAVAGKIINPKTGKPFGWYAMDTWTNGQQMIAQEIMISRNWKNRAKSLDQLEIQDYGEWQSRFKRATQTLCALPQNVLFTAHAMRTTDEEGNPIIIPSFYGKWGTDDPTTASQWMMGTVHGYGYLQVRTTVGDDPVDYRRWNFKRSGAYFGKDRWGVLEPYVNKPTLTKIQKLIDESNEKGE